ncbi:MAG TPA: carbohydrate ABC transporter permease [Lachnospiraceae bacterium]|jgi:putative aldouronate transport system permease protein|nr:carbohydrate ABC transporter permease [Lachnospiraceae bacterium]
MAKRDPNKIKNGSPVATVIIYVILMLLALICIYPVWYVIIISLSKPIVARTLDVYFLPKGLYFGSYKQLFKDQQMWICYGNTILYAGVCCIGMLITCAMAAYPLTSPYLVGRRFVVFFILIPMYFGGGLIPTFIWMTKLGMYNTRWAIIFPGIVSMWYIILVRTYFATIPEELRESARIDGANNFQILWNVYVPTSKPIMAVIAIYTIVAQWNSWYAASIYLVDQNLQPLQLYLRRKLILAQNAAQQQQSGGGQTSDMDEAMQQMILSADQLKYTMIVVATLPIMCIYPFLQKYFVKGVMVGSLKG